MKKIILSFVFTLMSLVSFGQIDVYLQEYSIDSFSERLHFNIKNVTDIPIFVQYIKVIDTNRNSIIYYSNDVLIINNDGGFANAWNNNYDLIIKRNSATGSNLWNTIYMVEIQFSEMRSGANPIKTNHYYTNGSVGVKLNSDNTTSINNIEINQNMNKFYDLSGRIIEYPIKGNIYIHNNKKIIY